MRKKYKEEKSRKLKMDKILNMKPNNEGREKDNKKVEL